MRFGHPKKLVHTAGNLREKVGCVCVTSLSHCVNCASSSRSDFCEGLRECRDVVAPCHQVERVGREPGSLCDGLNRPEGNPAQLDGALGDFVGKLLQLLCHFVEELVQAHKMRSFHVPMGLLG